MKRRILLALAVMLYLLIVACGGLGDETPEAQPPQGEEVQDKEDPGAGEQEAAIDYCNLPAGTRVTWFDLSTFIFIPESSYQMGYDQLAGDFDYEPSHPVSLGAFWMHETEVTNRQYANCVSAGQCAPPEQFPDLPYWFEDPQEFDDPVSGVTWEQANAYCQWIGARLPTEAEWELAARGVGADPYPWGTDAPDCEHANYLGCLDPDDPEPDFAGLRAKGISPFEMLDMAGNVNEWVSDWYAEDYYQISPSGSPAGPDTGELRVWRGGDYQSPADELLSYLRGALKPDEAEPDLGFRCAWSCGGNVPPGLCQLPPQAGPVSPPIGEPTPSKKPGIKGVGYCEWRGDQQSVGVVFSSTDGTDLSEYDFTELWDQVTCEHVGNNQVVCYGETIEPGDWVSVAVCPVCPEGYYFHIWDEVCKPLIQLDQGIIEELEIEVPEEECTFEMMQQGLCIPSWMKPENQCLPGMKYEEDCGCIWEWMECGDSWFPETPVPDCPPGWQPVLDGCFPIGGYDPNSPCDPGQHVVEPCGCIPYGWVCMDAGPGEDGWPSLIFPEFQAMPDEPMKPGDFGKLPGFFDPPEECNPDLVLRCPVGMISLLNQDGCQECVSLQIFQDCPEGYLFDAELGCCVPELLVSLCPSWTQFDPVTKTCIPIVFESPYCLHHEITIPACGPKPTVERPRCTNPRLYHSDKEGCQEAGCLWYQPATGGAPYCTYP